MADNPEASGKLVAGKYRLTRLLGKGGMGSVWKGVHATLATRVAVKFIDVEHADSPEARSRFENEARAAASLRSKYVVEVYDHGVSEDGRPFIVMEYLEGEPLDRRLDRVGRLPAKETAFILQQVCRALAKAHAARIVHRDLKPENVFLVWDDEDGADVAKVVDFGIAKFTDGSLGPSSATRTGSVLGTPYYMSPEQARGLRSVDYRTDLRSLGVIAYRCLVGTLPFDGEAIGDLLVKLCTAPIPVPSQLTPDVPPGFDAFIARALSRDPAERFQSVQEFSGSLAAVCGLSVRTYAAGEVGANGTGPFPALSAPALSAPAVTQVSASAEVPEAAATGAPLSQTKSAPAAARKSGTALAAGLAALVVLAIGVGVLAKVLAKGDASAQSGGVTAAASVLPAPQPAAVPVVPVAPVVVPIPSVAAVLAPAASVVPASPTAATAAAPPTVAAPPAGAAVAPAQRPALAAAPALRALPVQRRNEPARKGLVAPKKEIDIGY